MGSPLPLRLTRQSAVFAVVFFCILSAGLLLASTTYFSDVSQLPSGIANLVSSVSLGSGSADTCSVAHELQALNDRWGTSGLDMAVAHSGSGLRVRRALSRLVKAAPGDKFVIGVVGGSVTFGHGIDLSKDKPWPKLLQESLQRMYPQVQIEVVNGAIPATGTDYFSHCYSHHIPKNADMYIDEGAINDIFVASNADAKQRTPIIEYTENLVRDWLRQSDGTAVLMVSTFHPRMEYMNGADRHAVVSAYYDIPRISARPFMYPYILQNPGEVPLYFAPDGHPNQGGHFYLHDILLRYLLQQICVIDSEERRAAANPSFRPGHDDSQLRSFTGSQLNYSLSALQLPSNRINQSPGDKKVIPEVEASCVSANVVTEAGTWQLQPSKMEGFEPVTWHDKHYYSADKPGSTIVFDNIQVHGGSLGVYFLRQGDGIGNMQCWVDGNKGAATKLVGRWAYVSVGSIGVVAHGLSSGPHTLTCEVLDESDSKDGSRMVRIIAIVST